MTDAFSFSSEREKRIARYGSPLFNYKNSSLAPNGFEIFDFERIPKAQKYLPLNFCLITNNGEADIEITFDSMPDSPKYIPKGTIMKFENIWFRRIKIRNLSSSDTISANKIEITAQRLPLNDEYAKTSGIPIIEKMKVLLGV